MDDGKIYRKALYLVVKTMVSGSDFPLNQSNDHSYASLPEGILQQNGGGIHH